MILIEPPIRQCDDHGCGHYGASRGDRKHKGIDYACYPGSGIRPYKAGTVSKIGYTYADDMTYRYVEVKDHGSYRHRYFYISPLVRIGQFVTESSVIGLTQDLQRRYEKITNHCHYEIIAPDGEHINPEDYYDGHPV